MVVTFKRTSLGQFESYLDGVQTKWSICNGSLGMSGRDTRNIYLVYDRTRADGQPTKIQGTLQMCKKTVSYWLIKNRDSWPRVQPAQEVSL